MHFRRWSMNDKVWRSAASRAREEKMRELMIEDLEEAARGKGRVTFIANSSSTRRLQKVHLDDCKYAPIQSAVPYDSLIQAFRDGYVPCRECFPESTL